MDTLRVSVVNWAITPANSLQHFLDHIQKVVQEAAEEDAELVVLPENIDLERFGYRKFQSSSDIPSVLAEDFPKTVKFCQELAKYYNVDLIAGSHLRETKQGFVNTAIQIVNNELSFQDKNVLTQWELCEWLTKSGNGLVPSHNPLIGTLICYDSEFPTAARVLAETGVKLLCVPAFNERKQGFQRVRWSCRARAIELQIFVAHAALVGTLNREPVPKTYGSSAILCPSVDPFPERAVLAETPLGIEAIATADLDFQILDQSRNSDDVRNWHDRNQGDWRITKSEPCNQNAQ